MLPALLVMVKSRLKSRMVSARASLCQHYVSIKKWKERYLVKVTLHSKVDKLNPWHSFPDRLRIHTVPEQGWFSQPIYSTPSKKPFYAFCGFCFYREENRRMEGGKPENQEEPLGARARTNMKLNPRVTPGPGIESEPQQRKVSVLTTAPSLHP